MAFIEYQERPVEIKRKLCTKQRIILLSSYLKNRNVVWRQNPVSCVLQQLWASIDRLTKIVFISYLLYCFRGSQIRRYPISADSPDELECFRMFSHFSDIINHSCTIDILYIANIKTYFEAETYLYLPRSYIAHHSYDYIKTLKYHIW